jgi:hypothetical protein
VGQAVRASARASARRAIVPRAGLGVLVLVLVRMLVRVLVLVVLAALMEPAA